MTLTTATAVVALPVVCAVHRYSTCYGYYGLPHEVAMHNACAAGSIIAIIEALFLALSYITGT